MAFEMILPVITFFCALGVASTVFTTSPPCPDGWLKYSSSCYLFSYDVENWAEAETICRLLGGHLAEIQTTAENSFLKKQAATLSRTYNVYFIGATDINKLGQWTWMTSHDPVVFFDWIPNEPTNTNGGFYEQCVVLLEDGWNDGRCSDELNYICEKSVLLFNGTTDINKIGQWTWMTSHDRVVFSDWTPNEPNEY